MARPWSGCGRSGRSYETSQTATTPAQPMAQGAADASIPAVRLVHAEIHAAAHPKCTEAAQEKQGVLRCD